MDPSLKAKIRQFVDRVTCLVWMTDTNGVCTYISVGSLDASSDGERFTESTWTDFMHPDDRKRVGPALREAKEKRRQYQLKYRIVQSDGSHRWMMGSGAPRFDRAGVFLGYVGTVLDISEQEANVERLIKSEESYRLLAENSSDLICHLAPDTGVFVFASPAFFRVLGYDPSKLIGTSVFTLAHPDDIAAMRGEVERQIACCAEPRLLEIRLYHHDGHYVWLGATPKVLLSPETNEKLGVVVVARDITLEREANERLRRSEERFRSLTHLSSDWYWETDEEDRFTYISDGIERCYNIPAADIIGRKRLDFAYDVTQPGWGEYVEKVARCEPFRNIRYALMEGPGKGVSHASVSGEPVFGNGFFKGYRGVGHDVTEEVELSRKLTRLAEENSALVEKSLDMMLLIAGDGRILRANPATRETIGYDPAELLGRHYHEFIWKEDIPKTKTIARAAIESRQGTVNFENRWMRKDGSPVYLSWAGRWLMTENVLYATGRDITATHCIQEALAQSRNELARMLESIDDAFFALDRDWRATYINAKTAAFVGRTREELIGKVVWESVPEILDSPVMEHYRRAMETGRPDFFEAFWAPNKAWVEVRVYPNEEGISVYFHDITARHTAEAAVRESEKRLREVIEMTPAGYVLTDNRGIIIDVNPALCTLSGYSQDELIDQSIDLLIKVCPMQGALFVKGGLSSVHGVETTIAHKDGYDIHVLSSMNVTRDAEGHGLSVTAFITNITERKQIESRLRELATHDTLTGLPNRAQLNERLDRLIESVGPAVPVAVMFVDLDRFKEINDSMGHGTGDLLLCEVAERLRENLRPEDIVARLGGDEFVIAARCAKGTLSATRIANKLFASLSRPIEVNGQELFAKASIGIAMYPQDGVTRELLFQNADTAMYSAKAAGRNGYRFFRQEMADQVRARMLLETSLHRAIERKEFELCYQPRLDLKTMQVVGTEALIRWNHPQLGRISPLDFIPIAEERGFIEAIGNWVLEEACMQTHRLMAKLGRPLRVSVNLSARQVISPTLGRQVAQVLESTRMPAGLLELELTESALIENMDVSVAVFKALRALGVTLAVDDFGTGYSGLAYLGRFPLNVLKLDRSFINQQTEDGNNHRVIRAFIKMAHSLGLSVVAEGVETKDTLEFLRGASCNEAQGYFIAKPLLLDELEAFLFESTRENALQAS